MSRTSPGLLITSVPKMLTESSLKALPPSEDRRAEEAPPSRSGSAAAGRNSARRTAPNVNELADPTASEKQKAEARKDLEALKAE